MNNPSPKTKAVVAYLTFIGFLIAYFVNKEYKSEFATWHIKNMFGLLIGLFISNVLQNYTVGLLVYIPVAGFWLYSVIMATMGKKQGIPYLSEKFQEWFTFLD